MTLLDDPYLVLDYVDAAPQVNADDPVAISPRAFAAELAAIHRIDGTGAAFADLPRRTERIAEHLVDPPAELDASVGEADIRETLRAHWPPTQPEHVSLLHGDFWPGNVLGTGDEIVAVIDWENACVGDPLVDRGEHPPRPPLRVRAAPDGRVHAALRRAHRHRLVEPAALGPRRRPPPGR